MYLYLHVNGVHDHTYRLLALQKTGTRCGMSEGLSGLGGFCGWVSLAAVVCIKGRVWVQLCVQGADKYVMHDKIKCSITQGTSALASFYRVGRNMWISFFLEHV